MYASQLESVIHRAGLLKLSGELPHPPHPCELACGCVNSILESQARS